MGARKALAATAPLGLIVATLSGFIGFGGGSPASLPLESGATAPTDTTITWLNTVWGTTAHWWTGKQLWLEDTGKTLEYGHASANINAGLKVGTNTICDSSQVAPNGFWTNDSLYVSRMVVFDDSATAGLPDGAKINIYETIQDTSTKTIVTALFNSRHTLDSLNVGAFIGSGAVISAYAVSGINGLDAPKVHLTVQRFSRPAP